MQPFMGLADHSSLSWTVPTNEIRGLRLAQEPGSRLEPGEYANHVPFTVNGTDDFVKLGWPGEGTESSPFVISGLNISSDTYPSIAVINTDAFFVITDCLLDQKAGDAAIQLANTSHATIEYVTVTGYYGILCMSSNNTILRHLSVQTTINALDVFYCNNCHISDNNLITEDWLCIYAVGCNSSIIENNVFRGISNNEVNVGFFNSFNSSLESNQYPEGLGGLGFVECINMSATNEVIFGDSVGIIARDSLGIELLNCEVTALSDNGIEFDNADNSSISNCVVIAPGDYGILVEFSDYSSITDCEVSGECVNAIYLDTCNHANISGNHVTDAFFSGIGVTTSLSPIISGNIVQDVGVVGIYAESSDFAEVTTNHVTDSFYAIYAAYCDGVILSQNYAADSEELGIGTSNCENFTIADNMIENIGLAGIATNYEDDGYNGSISRNTITNASGGIIVTELNRIRIINNTMSNLHGDPIAFGFGIQINECDFLTIQGNEVAHANYGIVFDMSRHSIVESNHVSDALSGIGVGNSQNISVFNNELLECHINGISLSSHFAPVLAWDTSSNIQNNTLSGCGFGFNFDELSDYYRQSFYNNTINDKPLYYGLEQSNLIVQGATYGQIVLANCSNVNLETQGSSFGNVETYVHYSSLIVLDGIRCERPFGAIDIGNSQNVTVMNSEIECTDLPASMSLWGLLGPAIYGDYCQNTTILDSIILGNEYDYGVYLEESPSTMVLNCTFLDLHSGIWFSDSGSSIFAENLIKDSQYGISSYFGTATDHNLTIMGNEIYHCTIAGIAFTDTDGSGSVIQDNIVESCGVGIDITDSPIKLIKNNTIRWSYDYGISISSSTVSNISYNVIALSGIANGYDNQMQYWDDNSSQIGNWYDDYSGTGVYPISGGAGAQDRYPMRYVVTKPIIDQPPDVNYAEGSTGHELTWRPFDDSLRDWSVTIDGIERASAAWNFQNITVNIDGLDYGPHAVVVTVWDVDQNNVTDTVHVHVFDGTAPTINNPSDRKAFVDASEQTITWGVFDLHPDEYTLSMDGEVIETGTWVSGLIELNIDGFDEGDYEFTLIIWDIDGNTVNNTVLVRFIDDDVAPVLDSPEDITFYTGTLGNILVWNPADEYPSSYDIALNGTSFSLGAWTGSRIVLGLDVLEAGIYDFELTVFDASGSSASDGVRVTVLQTFIPSTSAVTPFDPGMLIIAGAAIGAGAIVVVVIYYVRKRQTS
jgi:parallel beta-helix repeat protein